jgi:hypothetical protein
MRLTKTLGIAGALILSALIGGTLIGSALATDESADPTTGTDSTGATYCQTFLDALASELGVTRDELTAAGKAAADTAIDAAVEAGDLTQERADALKERIDAAEGDGCGWLGKGLAFGRGFAHGFERGLHRGLLGGDVWEAAADALGIESSELIGALRDAGSLQAVAEDQGVSYDAVKASVTAAIQADLDAAVADGALTQERADALIERVTTWLDDGGPAGRLMRGIGPDHPDGDDSADGDAGA